LVFVIAFQFLREKMNHHFKIAIHKIRQTFTASLPEMVIP